MAQTLSFWKKKYNWREEEAKINELPQYKTSIDVDGFGVLDVHFVHAKSSKENAIPLLFIHGWPGSFYEVSKILPKLLDAGFDVVAPSLPGYGFSSYTDKPGFKLEQHAETLHKLMQKLGYEKYVVQGGDWGHFIARNMAILYPQHIQAIHLNALFVDIPPGPEAHKDKNYSEYEKHMLARLEHYMTNESAYVMVQGTKPLNLGFALHDSPVGMLAWMTDKLKVWTDSYPWTHTELITWTLLHYFNGPTTAINMYHENSVMELKSTGLPARNYVEVPSGVSAFPQEITMAPRCWAETKLNIVFWAEHDKGGHFAAWERPEEMVEDITKFYKSVWKA